MRRPILMIATLVAGLVVAACAAPSGEPASSDGGGSGSSQGQPAQTNEPATSDGGSGGGGGGSGANGSVTFEITGDVNASGELPFLPILGGFFQQGDASYMPFANSDNSAGEVVFITLSPDGNAFAYGNGTASVTGTDCEWNITRNDDGGATGSFNCNDAVAISESGGFGTADVHGDFDAHN